MRVHRRLPALLVRHARRLDAPSTSWSKMAAFASQRRADCAFSLALSTRNPPSIRRRFLSTTPMPSQMPMPSEGPGATALRMLQLIGEVRTRSAVERAPSDPSEDAQQERSGIYLNSLFRGAIRRGDYVDAQRLLHEMLEREGKQTAHPVEPDSYDRLLYEWSRHCTSQRSASSRQRAADLALMLTLVEQLNQCRRVNSRTFNTALAMCNKYHALEAARRVIELMRQSGREPKAFAYTNLISCCARLASKHKKRQAQLVDEARAFFDELVAGGTGVTIEAVNAMVFAYRATSERSSEAADLVELALREWQLKPDTSTISTLVVCLLKDENTLEAARWIEYALNHRIGLDAPVIRAVVDACRREELWDKVDLLQEQLVNHGVVHKDKELKAILKKSRVRDAESGDLTALSAKPEDVTMTRKVQKHTAAEMIEIALDLAYEGRTVEYSKTQWGRIFRYGDLDDVQRLMELIYTHEPPLIVEKAGISMAWLNHKYLKGIGHSGRWWEITNALDEMIQKTPRDLNIHCLNAAVHSCTHHGRLHEAINVIERMERRGINADFDTYKLLLECCGSVGTVEGALRHFGELERSGFKPTIYEVTNVLKAFAVSVQKLVTAGHHLTEGANLDVPASDLSKLALHALQFFDDSTTKYPELEVNHACLFHLFRSFLGAAETFDSVDFREFDEFSKTREPKEPESDLIVLSTAIQAICRDAPLEIVTSRVVNVAIDFFQRSGEPDSAFQLFNTMVSRGISPTADSIRLLFVACCHNNDEDSVQLGLAFLEHLVNATNLTKKTNLRHSIAKEALTWAARMDSESDSSLTNYVFDNLVESGILPSDPSAYVDMLGVYGENGNIFQAKQFLYRLLSDTGVIPRSAGNRLLQACSVAKAPLAAVDSLSWLKRHGMTPDITSYNSIFTSFRRFRSIERRDDDHDEDSDEDEEEEEEESTEQDLTPDDEVKSRARRSEGRDRLGELEQNLAETVGQMLSEMEETGVQPNARTFEIISRVFVERGEGRRALDIFDVVKEKANKVQVEEVEFLTEQTLQYYLEACTALAQDDSTIKMRIHEVRVMLERWHHERGRKLTPTTLHQLMYAFDAVDQWRDAVAILKNASELFGVQPTVKMFKATMEICNRAGQHKAAEQIFETMQMPNKTRRLVPDAACYVEAVYALEQMEEWTGASQLFMKMQKTCPEEEQHPALLNKIALGRYAEGRKRPN